MRDTLGLIARWLGEIVLEPGERLLSQRALRDHVSEVLKVAFENGIRYRTDFTSNAEPASSAGIPVYPDAVRFTGDGALSLAQVRGQAPPLRRIICREG